MKNNHTLFLIFWDKYKKCNYMIKSMVKMVKIDIKNYQIKMYHLICRYKEMKGNKNGQLNLSFYGV